jgi:hypothetical protein
MEKPNSQEKMAPIPTIPTGHGGNCTPLTQAEFHRLADVPPEVEWFANHSHPTENVKKWLEA